MKKIKYNYDEIIYEETLDNGLKVLLYPTNKTKNFYITVSTHFGAEVMKYKKNNKIYEVTKGSAHFLEHRVMDFTKNKKAMKQISEYGSLVNAYTTYNGTNYNIFGNEKILDNMKLLFDAVFKAQIKKEDVEKERGIILEEYYMYNDDPYFLLQTKLNENMFNKSFIKYPVLGTTEGINTVSDKELTRLYNDFYTLDNMFIVVVGNFNKESVLDYIKEYTSKLKSTKCISKVLKEKETDEVVSTKEEIILNLNEPKIIIGYKTKIPKDINILKYRMILGMTLGEIFGSTGECFLELNKEGINRYSYELEKIDNYMVLYFKASTNKINEFTNIVDKYINNLSLDSDALDRKKKRRLSSMILLFEDFMGVEDMITTDMFNYNKLLNKREDVLKNITLTDTKLVIKSLNLNNKSTLIIK